MYPIHSKCIAKERRLLIWTHKVTKSRIKNPATMPSCYICLLYFGFSSYQTMHVRMLITLECLSINCSDPIHFIFLQDYRHKGQSN